MTILLDEFKACAVRRRVGKFPKQQPTANEVAAIKEGSREFSEGKSVSLKQLRHEVGHRRQRKKSQARSRR